MMNEVVDGWKGHHVGSNQICTEEREDHVDIDKQARLLEIDALRRPQPVEVSE